ncbi:hypothetical protein CPAR01_02054 [Colletotrichum paranaense]|uniref:Uncharacterized protein n=4 Tax=Colletotrichum acutatum species complex TaxID=2707335 RepID=A0A9P7RAZ7_9PEZI|nr:uncharacterized protein CCOS01_03350 [Colletotrichum costaricense]XP_060353670.1 uncharacterized protein CPAR01_02054 [Colletotrichum paranaense]KAG7053750.1 hypothetical protein JMJ77_0000832 [Colletotrichum scovillei]KAI3528275.1 hypothetical protein CSPX01_16334 [Colletotrichum filicis]KAK0374067.1 hypothetical protein CLIM01_08590 [Colletotrichum limetticola]KAG7072044.1 hypothetical protein JMJ76_0004906 [Colletotrichum scovillei]KAG7080287.1 hypothetical protein JMJ78_0007384 [Collet
MHSFSTVLLFIAALAGHSVAQSCTDQCADVFAVASSECPHLGNTKEDADTLNGPKMSWKNNIWSTRGKDGAVVEIDPRACTLRTFGGRDDFCGIWIGGKEEKGKGNTEVKQPNALLQIPFNGGCCKIDKEFCKDGAIDWAQLLRVKKGPDAS